VVRRIVASKRGGTNVVVDVVAGVVVVVSGDVGSGIDSGPSPGEHAATSSNPTIATRAIPTGP
jgi:hypothetical protein